MADTLLIQLVFDAQNKTTHAFDQIAGEIEHMSGVAKLATAAVAGLTLATTAVVGGLVASGKVASDFQAQMSAVGAVISGVTAPQMAQLSELALQLGQDTTLSGVGASDAARAMEELAKGGVSVQDILGGGARGALLLASAGSLDFATAATIAAESLAMFKLAGSDLPHVADLLANAANKSSLEVTDLAASLKFVGPVANDMGLSIDEVTATLAELGEQGIKGSEAGTSLRSMMVNLAHPTKLMRGVLNEYNLEMFDADGHMKGLADIAGELHDKLGGLTDQQRLAALATLFGKESLAAATVVYGEGKEGIERWLAAVGEAGTAANVGAQRNDNLRGSFTQLKDSIETVEIRLGTMLLPTVRQVVDATTRGVNAMLPFIQHYGPLLAAALADGVTGLAAFGRAVAALARGFATGDFTNAFGPILAAIEAVFGHETMTQVVLFVSGLLTTLQRFRAGVVQFAGGIASGFGAVVEAIAALLTGRTTLAQFIGGMEIFVRTVLNNLGQLARDVAPYLTTFFGAIRTFIATYGPQLVAQFGLWALSFVDWIQTQAIPWLAPRLAEFGQVLWGWITGTAVPAVASAAGGLASALGDWVQGSAIPSLQTNLPVWGEALWGWITGTAVPTVTTAAGALASALGSWVQDSAIPYLQANLPLWGAALWEWITGTAVPTVVGRVVGLATALGEWVSTQAVPYLQAKLPEWLAVLTGWISGTVIPTITGAVVGIGNALVSWVEGTAIPVAREKLGLWTTSVASYVSDTSAPAITNVSQATLPLALNSGLVIATNESSTHTETWYEGIQRVLEGVPGRIQAALIPASYQLGVWIGESLPSVAGQMALWGMEIFRAIQTLPVTLPVLLFKAQQALWQWIVEATGPTVVAFVGWAAQVIAAALSFGASLLNALYGLVGTMIAAGAAIGQGIVDGIVNAIFGGRTRVATAAASLAEGASSSAAGHLEERSPSKVFERIGAFAVDGLVNGLTAGQVAAAKAGAELASAVAKAVTDSLGALSAIAAFDFARNSPSGETLGWFRHLTESLVATIQEASTQFTQKALDATSAFAKTAGEVGSAVKSAVEGLTALGTTNWAKVSPDGNAMGWFRHLVESLVATFAEAAAGFDTDALTSASTFAEAVGKVGGVLKSATEGLAALRDFASPPLAAVYAFGKSIRALINDLALVAEQVTQDAAAQAATFAESAGKVVGLLGAGVDAFAKLRDYEDPPRANLYAFGKSLRATINDFALLAEQVTQEATSQAATFAEGAGKVVTTLGSGVEAFGKLAQYVDPPRAAIYAFGKSLRAMIADVALIAEQVSQDAAAQAGRFAEGAGKVLGLLGNGVKGLMELATFVAPSKTAIDNFVNAVNEIVARIVMFATQFSVDGLKAGDLFATAAGKALDAIGKGLADFKEMGKVAPPSAQAIDDLTIAISYIVRRFAEMAANIGGEGLARATAVATAAETAAKALETTFTTIKKLDEKPLKGMLEAAMHGVSAALSNALGTMQGMSNDSARFLTLALNYKSNMEQAAAAIAAGSALSAVSGFQAGADLGQGVSDGVNTALGIHSPSTVMQTAGENIIAGLVAGITDGTPEAVKAAAEAAQAIADAIGAAVGALSAISGFTAPPLVNLRAFLDTWYKVVIEQLLPVLVNTATGLGTDGVAAVTATGQALDQIGTLLKTGVEGLTAVATFVAPPLVNLRAFLDSWYHVMVEVLLPVLRDVGVGLATGGAQQAGAAAETIGKIGALLKTSAEGLTALVVFVAPSAEAVDQFVAALLRITTALLTASASFTKPALDAASVFADSAGKVVALLASGVQGFTAMVDFVAPADTAITAFAATVVRLVRVLVEATTGFQTEALAALRPFAEAASAVANLAGNGAADLLKLADFVAPSEAAMTQFAQTLVRLVQALIGVAGTFQAAALAAMRPFAEAASAVANLAGNSAADLVKLADFVAPSETAITAFAQTIVRVVQALVGAAGTFQAEALAALRPFAEGASAVATLAGGGVADLLKLADFVAPSEVAVAQFAATVVRLVRAISAVAGTFQAEALAAATTFSGAAQAVLAMLGNGVSGLIGLGAFVAPADADLDRFAGAVAALLDRLRAVGTAFSSTDLGTLGTIGTVLSTVFDGLRAASEVLTAVLSTFLPSTDEIDAFLGRIEYVLSRLAALATRYSAAQLGGVQQFAAAISAVFGALRTGNEALTSLSGGGNSGGGGGLLPLVSVGAAQQFASGGYITEPIAGVGLRSGKPYAFGEQGKVESVTMPGGRGEPAGGGAGKVVSNTFNIYPQQVALTARDTLRAFQRLEQAQGGGWS